MNAAKVACSWGVAAWANWTSSSFHSITFLVTTVHRTSQSPRQHLNKVFPVRWCLFPSPWRALLLEIDGALGWSTKFFWHWHGIQRQTLKNWDCPTSFWRRLDGQLRSIIGIPYLLHSGTLLRWLMRGVVARAYKGIAGGSTWVVPSSEHSTSPSARSSEGSL